MTFDSVQECIHSPMQLPAFPKKKENVSGTREIADLETSDISITHQKHSPSKHSFHTFAFSTTFGQDRCSDDDWIHLQSLFDPISQIHV